MARPEPFRALLDEFYASENSSPPFMAANEPVSAPVEPAPAVGLSRRLDQVALAGVTPARGVPRQPRPHLVLGATPMGAMPIAAPVAALPRSIELPVTVRREVPVTIPAPPVNSSLMPSPLDDHHDLDALLDISLKPAPVELPLAPLPPPPPPLLVQRPPPLPPRAGPVLSPPPVLVSAAAVLAVLDDDVTSPTLRQSSSDTSKLADPSFKRRDADLYRLQLEFEDTPARPLPRHAGIPLPNLPLPNPLDAPQGSDRLGGVESTDLQKLEDLAAIADLDALAQALGLKGVGQVSIPSYEGVAVDDADEADDLELNEWPTLAGEQPVMGVVASGRRALVLEALSQAESIFPADETTPVDRRRPSSSVRSAMSAERAVSPVIVKIPSRPKVTAEAREQARRLYLTALDELAKGDRVGAVGHLKLAMHYDDATQLYSELLGQLEKRAVKAPRPGSAEGNPLMVQSISGSMRRPKEHPRVR